MPLSITATQALAQAAEMKTSPFIVREVLGEDCRLALTAYEQRGLHDRTVRLASLSEGLLRAPLPGSDVTLGEARLDEMARAERLDEVRSLLNTVVGPDRAAAVVRRVAERVRRSG